MFISLEACLSSLERKKFHLLAALVFLLCFFTGWYLWHLKSVRHIQQASIVYHQMQQEALDKNQPIDTYLKTLSEDYADTIFFVYAKFYQAKQLVEKDAYPEAAAALREVLAQKPPVFVRDVTLLRLARLDMLSDPNLALKSLHQVTTEHLQPFKLHLMGDAYAKRSEFTQARDYYEQAKQQLSKFTQNHPGKIQEHAQQQTLIQRSIDQLPQNRLSKTPLSCVVQN